MRDEQRMPGWMLRDLAGVVCSARMTQGVATNIAVALTEEAARREAEAKPCDHQHDIETLLCVKCGHKYETPPEMLLEGEAADRFEAERKTNNALCVENMRVSLERDALKARVARLTAITEKMHAIVESLANASVGGSGQYLGLKYGREDAREVLAALAEAPDAQG
jgi:hypothetical protein